MRSLECWCLHAPVHDYLELRAFLSFYLTRQSSCRNSDSKTNSNISSTLLQGETIHTLAIIIYSHWLTRRRQTVERNSGDWDFTRSKPKCKAMRPKSLWNTPSPHVARILVLEKQLVETTFMYIVYTLYIYTKVHNNAHNKVHNKVHNKFYIKVHNKVHNNVHNKVQQ